MTTSTRIKSQPAPAERVPLLRAGDRLTRAEFERRYEAMRDLKKAELIEGVVYMPSPVSTEEHGEPHFSVTGWLFVYKAFTPGVQGADNATVRLDLDNDVQPDDFLRILPECGGQSHNSADGRGYVEGSPELAAEIAASSATYDLHDKLNVYRRNGVREYIVWRVEDGEIDWFALRDGRFEHLKKSAAGIYQSEVFPGLWLDGAAMLRGDMAAVIEVLQQGLASSEHALFVKKLQKHAAEKGNSATGGDVR